MTKKTMLEHSKTLGKLGFYVFPLAPNSKLPVIENFPSLASRDESVLETWWFDPVLEIDRNYNIGISTSRFGDNESLIVVDVDNKGSKKGSDSLLDLELQGFEFPKTYTQRTPTGGLHLVYKTTTPVKNGTNVLGSGLDIRGKGGYIVGAYSTINAKGYDPEFNLVANAPAWLIERCGRPAKKAEVSAVPVAIDQTRAAERAVYYLENEAPVSIEGNGGDQTAYRVACRLKDFGLHPKDCLELMLYHWNYNCSPPWSPEHIKEKIDRAFKYGTNVIGSAAPETDFKALEVPSALHPFDKFNSEYAFVTVGGGSHILWETKGPRGDFKLEHLGIPSFHQKHAADVMTLGDGKTKSISEMWMRSPKRRSYDGICFMPGIEAPPAFYNLWRGFAVKPTEPGERISKQSEASVEAFKTHAFENVCRGDTALFRWLMGYFAHLVQRPWEKPLVALVFKGLKGVGKNALVDRVGHLFGGHYLLTSNRRFLTGNFNAHLENLLLFTLDEAFWSGDKQAEGTLKDLITGKTHFIEQKGREPYTVENCTRVCILGNEEWLVPASHDERRYGVFNVGEGKKQNRAYFQRMREDMEAGGYRLLLRYFLDYDLSGLDINAAPATAGLLDQKVASLDPFHQWWLECLQDGRLVGADFGGEWTVDVEKERFRQAFRRYIKDRQIRNRIPEDRTLGKLLKVCLPSVDCTGKKRSDGDLVNMYRFPDLEQCRKEWCDFIGHAVNWNN